MKTAATAAMALALASSLSACQPRQDAAIDSEPGLEHVRDADVAAPPSDPPVGGNFRCGEILVAARPDAAGEGLTLSMSGHRLVLAHRGGGDYVDEHGNQFRIDGDGATLSLQGAPPRRCTPTDQVSPWNEAAARGVRFRAVGQEPGWILEVGGDDWPTLSAQLDYGERSIEVEHAEPRADGDGFKGTATDGTAVLLEIERETCIDPMSGEPFQASAWLRVGKQSYEGCGAFLQH